MKKVFQLIAAAFASLATSPAASRSNELKNSLKGYPSISGHIPSFRGSGGGFRELNQRQRRKLHRQVPQLRKR